VNRRQILQSLLAGLAIPLAPVNLAKAAQSSGRRLILVELSGANDGLNTVVPYRDERYREIRPNISLREDERFTLNSDLALHSSLTSLGDAWEAGDLAIIQGLGYPGQNRSHFKSIAIWETGGDGSQSGVNGWLTEDIMGMRDAAEVDAHGISLDGGMGVFAASSGLWLSMTSLNQFATLAGQREQAPAVSGGDNPALAMLLDRGHSLDTAMTRISAKIERLPRSSSFRIDAGDFGRQAAMAAQLIDAGIDAPVLKIKLDGFDTHEAQPWRHRDLLRDLGRGLAGLRQALIQSGRWQDTLVMTYSEFGRRAVENESMGTDHGTAAPHFLMSGGLNGGIWGAHPDLGNLTEGDMEFTLDYRTMYHTVLRDWFGLAQNRFESHFDPALDGVLRS
jgi:uncharacterized protein (DUF1501 family)